MGILELKEVTKSFGGVVALNRVSLEVEEGEITALLGPNGSGKSTLINVVSGVYPPDSGRIFFSGKEITSLSPHEIANLGIIRTFQVPRVFKNLSVIENMLVAAREQRGESLATTLFRWRDVRAQEEENIRKALEILEFLEIEHMKNEYAGNLSGGQQKLLALGRALMAEPKLLLLDEPVAGVAPPLARKIFEKILELRSKGLSFLIIEHNVDVLMDFAGFVYVLHRGEIVAKGKPEEILESKQVLEVYFGE
jgi:branched-chain amino acid transport system ATP-binding protein